MVIALFPTSSRWCCWHHLSGLILVYRRYRARHLDLLSFVAAVRG